VDREWQIVTACFVCNSEIGAGPSPLLSMRRDPAPASAELGKEMGQFVAESPIDLGLAVVAETAI
jgi:hypothetical protein